MNEQHQYIITYLCCQWCANQDSPTNLFSPSLKKFAGHSSLFFLLEKYSCGFLILTKAKQLAFCSLCRNIKTPLFEVFLYFCARTKIRTWDRSSISRVLYQLSYSRISYFYYPLIFYKLEQSTSCFESLLTFEVFAAEPSRAIRV